jgi:hypothetical protein
MGYLQLHTRTCKSKGTREPKIHCTLLSNIFVYFQAFQQDFNVPRATGRKATGKTGGGRDLTEAGVKVDLFTTFYRLFISHAHASRRENGLWCCQTLW